MLIATALVIPMSLPGLAILNTIAMVFTAYAIASVVWVIYGYSLAFGTDIGGVIGSPAKLFLSGVDVKSLQETIQELLFVAFQGTFAAITLALISGSYVERMKFSAWLLFSILWVSLVYVPIAHWV